MPPKDRNELASQLESLLKSKIPVGTNILMMGPPGAGKSTISRGLTSAYMDRGFHCVFVTMNHPPEEIRASCIRTGHAEKKGALTVVDAYSWLWGESNEAYRVKNLTNLNDLSIRFFTACDAAQGKIFFVLDSISNFLTYNAENEVIRLLEVYMARAKKNLQTGVFVAEEDIHTGPFYKMLSHMADGVIEVKMKEGSSLSRNLRITKFRGLAHSTSWHEFTIGEDGAIKLDQKALA